MNDHQYRPTALTALILSPDPLAGALIGAAAELAGVRPAYPRSGEIPRDALGRSRPAFVLIDCDDDAARDEALLGPALMLGSRLLFFGGAGRAHDLAPLADRFQARMIVLPRDIDVLGRILSSSEPSPREQVNG